jgi:hypothetical protein
MSWLAASGRPNCLRSRVYWRAACQQNSAAPRAPQEMPKRALLRHPNGPLSPLYVRQQSVFGDKDVIEDHLTRHRGAQRQLSLDLGRRIARAAASTRNPRMTPSSLAQTTATSAIGTVGNPHLAAAQAEPARNTFRSSLHAVGVRAVIGLGESEAADQFTGGERGRYFCRCSSLP